MHPLPSRSPASAALLLAIAACAGDDRGRPRPHGDDDDDTGVIGDDDDDDTTPDGPRVVRGPEIGNLGADVRLAKSLTVSTDVPTALVARIDDGVRARILTFPGLAETHDVRLLELHEDTDYTVALTLTDAAGSATTATAAFSTDAIDFLLPELELLVEDGAEPGVRVIPVGDPDVPFVVLVVDVDGRPVYAQLTTDDTKAVAYDPASGTFGMLRVGVVERRDLAGAVVASWGGDRDAEEVGIHVPGIHAFHHEATFAPDGSFWSFHKVPLLVPDYPADYANPSFQRAATIDDDHVIHVAPDGTVLADFSLAERLDTAHIGYGSLDTNPSGNFDWAHANGVVPWPDGHAVLVSMRHQDAVVKLDATTGEVAWLFAQPDGWKPAVEALRLQPATPDLVWTNHQHGPFPTADGFAVYDNGNDHRTTPYQPVAGPEAPYTRLVRFVVDEQARTVATAESWVQVDDGVPLISEVLGNDDVLPVTGHLFGTFSYLYREGGVDNLSVGLGAKSVRLVEVDAANGRAAWDLRLRIAYDVADRGVQVDRATLVPSLYPEGVATWE